MNAAMRCRGTVPFLAGACLSAAVCVASVTPATPAGQPPDIAAQPLEETSAGHGLGTTKSTRDAEDADIAAFVFWRAGVPEWQPKK